MANTEPIIPTAGTEAPSKYLMGLEDDPDADKFNKALEDAFGPQATVPPESEDNDTTLEPDPNAGADGAGDSPPPGASGEGDGAGGEDGASSDAIGGNASDFAARFQERYGHAPSQEEIDGYLQLAEWAAGLTPEQQQAINNALVNPQAYTQPVDTTPKPTTPDEDPEYAALIEEFGADHPLIKRLQRLEQNTQQFAQTQAQITQQEILHKINAGTEVFKAKYELTDDEIYQLQGAVARSGLFPGFVSSLGDHSLAIQQAMDYQYHITPEFRQREIDKQLEATRAQQQAADTRKRKASSVSGTGGNGADRTTPPPKTTEDRWAAVAAGIAEAQNNGQQP